jgi:hypothetical protein
MRVQTPLHSLAARNQYARTLVFMPWHHQTVARAYAVPSNPRTASQAAQRATHTQALRIVQNYLGTRQTIDAWRRAATASRTRANRLQYAIGQLSTRLLTDPDPLIVLAVSRDPSHIAISSILPVSGTPPPAPIPLQIRLGPHPRALHTVVLITTTGTVTVFAYPAPTPETRYLEIRLHSPPVFPLCSGIYDTHP